MNPEACESYVVWKKEEGQAAERVGETKKTKMLITGLKSDKFYSFEVKATNDIIKSISKVDMEDTNLTKAEVVALSAVAVGVTSVLGGALLVSEFAPGTENKVVETAKVITGIATIPFNILVAPVVALTTVVYLLMQHRDG